MWARHLSRADLTQCADGELTGAQLRRAEDHLRTCRLCADAREQARAAARLLLTLPPTPPPYDLRDRILSRVTAQPLPQLRCKQAITLIHESLDKPLSLLSAGFLRLHLDTCPDCNVELATLSEAARSVRSLRPVPAPLGLRQAAYARVPARPAPSFTRLRPALAAAAVAAAALFLTLRSTPERVVVLQPVSAKPPVVAVVPQPSSQPEVTAPSVDDPVVIASTPVETREIIPVRASSPTPRSVARRAGGSAPILISFPAGPAPEPTVVAFEPTPRALRALRAVARAAAVDFDPRVSLATVGERLATLDSEDIASALPTADSPPATEPAGSPTSRNHESGATGDSLPFNLAELVEGTTRAA